MLQICHTANSDLSSDLALLTAVKTVSAMPENRHNNRGAASVLIGKKPCFYWRNTGNAAVTIAKLQRVGRPSSPVNQAAHETPPLTPYPEK